MILRTTKSALTYAVLTSAAAIKPRPKLENRRASATRALQAGRVAPVRVVARSADFDRCARSSRGCAGRRSRRCRQASPLSRCLPSPVRAAEFYAVTLRLVGARTAAPVTRIVPTLSATRLTTKPQAFVMQPIAAPVTPVGRPLGVTARSRRGAGLHAVERTGHRQRRQGGSPGSVVRTRAARFAHLDAGTPDRARHPARRLRPPAERRLPRRGRADDAARRHARCRADWRRRRRTRVERSVARRAGKHRHRARHVAAGASARGCLPGMAASCSR